MLYTVIENRIYGGDVMLVTFLVLGGIIIGVLAASTVVLAVGMKKENDEPQEEPVKEEPVAEEPV